MSGEKIKEKGHVWIPIRGEVRDEERCINCQMRYGYFKRTSSPCKEAEEG